MKILKYILYFSSLLIINLSALQIDKVVIWGHKLHSHTHSYIHSAFFEAFKHLGYQVNWFDDTSSPKDFDYSNTLFIVANAVDKNVPLRNDCYYIFHHCWCKEHQCAREKYGHQIDLNRCISIKCFWKPYLDKTDSDWEYIKPCHYVNYKQKECVLPWATDLLPHEIDNEILNINKTRIRKQVCYLGTIGDTGNGANLNELNPFFKAAKTSGLKIYTNDPWARPLSNKKNIQITKKSLFAPAIQGKWQRENGYIPCRVFKAISYGKLGITNSKFVSDLFDNKIVYNPNTEQLFYDAVKALESNTPEKQIELMRLVRDKHTYINRIEFILKFLEDLNNE